MGILVPGLSYPSYRLNKSDPLARGLVGFFFAVPGRHGYGSDKWLDISKQHNHGTLTNMDPATAWTPDAPPGGFGSLAFSRASNQYVNIGDVGDTTSSVCLSAVFQLTDVLDAYYTLLAKRDGAGNPTNWSLRKGDNSLGSFDELEFYYYNTSFSVWGTSDANLVANTWYWVCCFYDGINDPVIHLNGRLLSGSWVFGSGGTSMVANDADASIGALNTGAESFNGKISSARIRTGVSANAVEEYLDDLRGNPRLLEQRQISFLDEAGEAPAGDLTFHPFWTPPSRIIGGGVK